MKWTMTGKQMYSYLYLKYVMPFYYKFLNIQTNFYNILTVIHYHFHEMFNCFNWRSKSCERVENKLEYWYSSKNYFLAESNLH